MIKDSEARVGYDDANAHELEARGEKTRQAKQEPGTLGSTIPFLAHRRPFGHRLPTMRGMATTKTDQGWATETCACGARFPGSPPLHCLFEYPHPLAATLCFG